MIKYLTGVLGLSLLLLSDAGAEAKLNPRVDQAAAMNVCAGVHYEDCVVRQFKDTLEASLIRGRQVFKTYCVLCHGSEGLGDGRAASLHNPPPFNLTKSVAPRDYINRIIRIGGAGMGRGKAMPPWNEQLTYEQIEDTLNYLESIRK